MILEFHDFEQPWMRYALGMGSSKTKCKSIKYCLCLLIEQVWMNSH